MQKVLVAVSLSLAAGFALGAWMITSDDEPSATSTPLAAAESGDFEVQIRQLEQDLAAERSARRLLEEQVNVLNERLDVIEHAPDSARSERQASVTRVVGRSSDPQNRVAAMIEQSERMREWRLNRFVEGGYTEDEARVLMDAESDAQLQSMYEQWEAQRNGSREDPWANMMNSQDILRERLGDAEYERYLKAQGSTATVQLSNVMDRSPGSVAGLRAGDEIVSYNGERTFSILDLRRLTMQGEPGESVIVEIDRDGVRMQMTLPRGPIGVNGSGVGVSSFNMGTN